MLWKVLRLSLLLFLFKRSSCLLDSGCKQKISCALDWIKKQNILKVFFEKVEHIIYAFKHFQKIKNKPATPT